MMKITSLTIKTTFITCCFVPALSLAVESPTQSSSVLTTIPQANQVQQQIERQLQVNQSTINQTTTDQWTEWGLTQKEWLQYEELKKGARGIWTPNLDPLTMLGVEAKNDNERNHYAELLAKKEYARVERELAFQIAYTQAFQRLYPDQLPFGVDDNSTSNINGNRIIYFTQINPKTCATCAQDLTRLLGYVGNHSVDIYILDATSDTQIRDWALKQHIDVEKVKARQITLNYDKGYWLKYGGGKIPVAFQVKGTGEWQKFIY
ncbi:TIGR03759 family integrating conjugative element protein [[Pasteurella] aerogenes]